MTTLYLIDTFGSPVSGSTILDVVESPTGTTSLTGCFVVRVPEGLPVQKPTNLGDLLTKKYAAYLAYYASFTKIAYDDLLDTVDVNLVAAGTAGMFGDRGTIRLNAASIFTSNMKGLVAPNPTQALITWDIHTVSTTDVLTASVTRTYQEVASDATHLTCEVSFNNGATWLACTDGVALNIPLADRGVSFIIRLTNIFASAICLDSWAVLYG